MSFRHFRYPHQFSNYKSEPQLCEICEQVRLGYEGPFYGKADIDFVCEQCLREGKLAEIEAFTNDGNPKALQKQLAELRPELQEAQIMELVQQRTSELEHRTPQPQTWQNLIWPVHCADYCQFIKEVGKADLSELEVNGNGKLFFSEHLNAEDKKFTNVEDVWEAMRPDSPEDNSVSYTVGVYLFQCSHCQQYIILWDSS